MRRLPPKQATDRRPTVLLVDDDEVNLLMTAAALRDRGFDITSTTGGEEALPKGFPFQILHGNKGLIAEFPHLMNGADIGMVEG